MAIKTAIGLMSGTSMDGIDVALLRTDGEDFVEHGASGFYRYKPDVISKIKAALEDAKQCEIRKQRSGSLADVEALITELHADAVSAFLQENAITPDSIDLLGFHGQTVLHRPDKGFTIQLGDGRRLANLTGIDCVYDLRANDMAHGGQGAPLVPVYHQALANQLFPEKPNKNMCFVNIGGIANITYVGEELIALDSGPGNTLIDQWVQQHAGIPYDDAGMIAAEGAVKIELVEAYLSHSYFTQPLPKSLDRNDFKVPDPDAGGVEDVARSLARVTAEAIIAAKHYLPDVPETWIICGGGQHNPYIMEDLRSLAKADGASVMGASEVDLNGDAIEAECWAYLAVRSQKNLPLTFPKTTGVSKPVSGGLFAKAAKETGRKAAS